MKQDLFLGIDGGGTQTKAVLVGQNGAAVDHSVWEALNYNSVGPAQLTAVLHGILSWAGGYGTPAGVGIAAAGVGNADARHAIQEAIDAFPYRGPVTLAGDQEAALMGAFGQMRGMVLVVGTGSICYGKNRKGKEWRTGGWGHRVDDLGSAYDIGRSILAAAVQGHDGRIPHTELSKLVLEHYGFSDISEMIRFVYAPGTHKQDIARASILLDRALEVGDAAAWKIADRATDEWVRLVLPVANGLAMQGGALALCGSVAQNNLHLRRMFAGKVQAWLPALRIVLPKASACEGAAWMAQKAVRAQAPRDAVCPAGRPPDSIEAGR